MSDDKLISTGNQKFDTEFNRIKLIEEIVDRVIQRNKNIDGILESIKVEKNKWNLFKRGQSSSGFEKLKDELTLLIADLRRFKSYEEFLTSLSHYLEHSKNDYEIRVQEAKMDLEYVSGFTNYILFNSSHFQRNQIELTNSFELFSSLSSEARSKVYKSESELILLNSRIGILDKTKVMLGLLKEISTIDNYIQVSGLTDPDKIQKLKEISLKSISVGEELKKPESKSGLYSQNTVTGMNQTYFFGGKAFKPNYVVPKSAPLPNGMKLQPLAPWNIKNNSIFYTESLANDVNARKNLNHDTRTESTNDENTVGPHRINEVRLKLKDWGTGWEPVESLFSKSFFEFENSFQLQSFEVLKK